MDYRRLRPPAITTGLVPFFVLLRALGLSESMKLTPDAIFHLDMNRLSFYPLVFWNVAHLVVGAALFAPLCGQFELSNGTVRTGIVLNVAAVITGVAYNVLVKFSFGWVHGAEDCGTSTWILAFAAFLSTTRWSLPTFAVRSATVGVPAWVLPFVAFLVLAVFEPVLVPLHALSLAIGYGLGTGHLGFLVEPTTNVVEWIEAKLAPGIRALNKIVVFVGEVEARELRRGTGYARRISISTDDFALPVDNLTHGP